MSGLTPSYVVGSTRGCTWAAGKGTLVTPVFFFHTWLLRDRKKEIKSHMTFSPFVCRSRQPLETDWGIAPSSRGLGLINWFHSACWGLWRDQQWMMNWKSSFMGHNCMSNSLKPWLLHFFSTANNYWCAGLAAARHLGVPSAFQFLNTLCDWSYSVNTVYRELFKCM